MNISRKHLTNIFSFCYKCLLFQKPELKPFDIIESTLPDKSMDLT